MQHGKDDGKSEERDAESDLQALQKILLCETPSLFQKAKVLVLRRKLRREIRQDNKQRRGRRKGEKRGVREDLLRRDQTVEPGRHHKEMQGERRLVEDSAEDDQSHKDDGPQNGRTVSQKNYVPARSRASSEA